MGRRLYREEYFVLKVKLGDLVKHKYYRFTGIIIRQSRNGMDDCWTVLRAGELRNWWSSDMEVIGESS